MVYKVCFISHLLYSPGSSIPICPPGHHHCLAALICPVSHPMLPPTRRGWPGHRPASFHCVAAILIRLVTG